MQIADTIDSMKTGNVLYMDLHLHSNCSDGVLAPDELVELALESGLSAIALADHDSVAGVERAQTAGIRLGVEVVAAVELSVQFGEWQDVHLLGYGIDFTDQIFLERLNGFRQHRERRNVEILKLVNKKLVDENKAEVNLQEVLFYTGDTIGRPHIARALLERGYVKSVEAAFDRYLIPCNVPKKYWPIDDAIAEIKRIGGAAVLAHPTTISNERSVLHSVIFELTKMGLDGIEAFNNLALPEEMEFLRRLAGKMGLLVTGGSDFHGIEEGVEMGKGRGGTYFNADLLVPLRKLLDKRKH
jgi:predicted metal-dependent phosphoesterase TrpH